MKQMRKWIVVYFKDGKVTGPVWTVESLIKPTRWAKYALPQGRGDWYDGITYKIAEVAKFSENGYKDSYLKALP